MNIKRALYAGSFDPFTNGHLHIVKCGAELFDELFIGIASNYGKKRSTDVLEMKNAIQCEFSDFTNISVVVIDGLVADFCKENNVSYLLRGLRNTSDYLYEENIAKINREINPDLKTIYFRADNDVISSTMIRELIQYGKDVSKFVPEQIYKIYKEDV